MLGEEVVMVKEISLPLEPGESARCDFGNGYVMLVEHLGDEGLRAEMVYTPKVLARKTPTPPIRNKPVD